MTKGSSNKTTNKTIQPNNNLAGLGWVDEIFDLYSPGTKDTAAKHSKFHSGTRAFATLLLEATPPGVEQKIVVRKLLECVMIANGAGASEVSI